MSDYITRLIAGVREMISEATVERNGEEYIPATWIDASLLCDEVEQLIKTNIQLEKALNPLCWTREMSQAWHGTIPDTQKAFNALHRAAVKPLAEKNK